MPQTDYRSSNDQLAVTISIAIILFLAIYLGLALNTASVRYTTALSKDERLAHTIVGKEGYEYIFEPNTHVLIDRIKPNDRKIILYVFIKEYIPIFSKNVCTFPDQQICTWINLNVLYGHDPRPEIQKMILYASISGLIFAGGFYLLTRFQRNNAMKAKSNHG